MPSQRKPGNPLSRLLHAQHTAFSATLLLTGSAVLSRLMGLVRDKFIAWLFGAGPQTDAYNAAFQLPEMLNYFLVGGTASITFVTILSQYRERGQQAEGQRAMNAILTAMLLVLGSATVAAWFLAPAYVHTFFPGFAQPELQLCVRMTRILLPAQLCFFSGGVFAAVLLTNKQFGYQAITPLVYNAGIILGGAALAHTLGISSLAVGAVGGAFFGAFLLNAAGAYRIGARYSPVFDLNHPGLRQWVRLSIPLMLGVSLVTFDTYILAYFASHLTGDITRLTYAKRLFTAPMAIVGQAAGAASLPFFASLVGQGKMQQFAASVNSSVTRLLALSFLLSGWMVTLAAPATDLIFRGGKFHAADARQTSAYFAIFSLSLCLWAAQAIYARAFYAASDTLTPMLASTAVTLASLPIYWLLFHRSGAVGLAIASDLGILLQTVTLALLLQARGLVRLSGLQWGELARTLAAACAAAAALLGIVRITPPAGQFTHDLLTLTVGTLAWLLVSYLVLQATGSLLPQQLLQQLRRRG